MKLDINWFKLNRSLHRNIGYFCIGMTLIFAISGIALNHVEDWNPNYQVSQETVHIAEVSARLDKDDFEPWLLKELALDTKIKARFKQSPTKLKLFSTDEHTIIINKKTNQVIVEQVKARPLLRSLNFLHLNEARKAWTYFSDFYAALLIYLALSALFMIKGKKGVIGPRGLLVVAGFIIPAAFVVFYAT